MKLMFNLTVTNEADKDYTTRKKQIQTIEELYIENILLFIKFIKIKLQF